MTDNEDTTYRDGLRFLLCKLAKMPRNNAAASADPLLNHKRYEKTKNLNAGAFGFVQLAKDKLNKGAYVAVKFIPRGEHVNEYVEAEIINHRQLLHPHIIQFQEVCLQLVHLGGLVCVCARPRRLCDVDAYSSCDRQACVLASPSYVSMCMLLLVDPSVDHAS
jgi:serine/threonine protein kinase